MSEHVALVGFMAAGKSRVGKRLATELNLPLVDTDAAIVARYGPIAEIFAREGEVAFRAYECEAVRDALAGPAAVLALGGGAIAHPPTRALLAAQTCRVYLEVAPHVLLARLRTAKTVRPLVGPAIDIRRVRALLDARLPLYRESEITVSCGRRSTGAIVREIAERLAARAETIA